MKRSSVIVVAACACIAATAQGEIIHAVAGGNLIWFDSASPGTVHTVGPLGTPGGRTLAYNPGDGFLYTLGGPSNDVDLIRITPATGAGTAIASLPGGSYYEALEWVGSKNSLVVSQGPTPGTVTLSTLSFAGAVNPLVTNNRDNDYSVWDSVRDIFYVNDPNGVAQFVRTSLSGPSNTNLGAVAIGDPAYSAASDCFYATNWQTNTLLKIVTDGVSAIVVTNLGTIGGAPVAGMAIIPTPATTVLALGALSLFRRARRSG